VLWLHPSYRTVALATTWSDNTPGQSLLVERMPTTSTPIALTRLTQIITSSRGDLREMTSVRGTGRARAER